MIRYLVHYEPNGFIRNCVHEPGEEYIAMCEQRGLAFAVFEGSPPDSIHDACYFSDGEVKARLPCRRRSRSYPLQRMMPTGR